MATATSVVHAGGKLIFTDVLKEDLCMDPEDLKEKIRSDTKAVMVVHIGGIISSKFNEIRDICKIRLNKILLLFGFFFFSSIFLVFFFNFLSCLHGFLYSKELF